jgi:MSHA biogenesis protein MshN
MTAQVEPTLAPTGPAVVTPQPNASTPARRKSPATVRQSSPLAVSGSAGTGPAPAAIEVTGHPLTAVEQAENKYREGVKSVRQLRAEDAEQQLRAALALDPKHVQARETLAALLVEHGRWLEAQAVLEEGLRLLPNQASFGFLLARLYVEQGRDAAGLQLLERLESHAGGEPEYLAFMAALYQRTGRHADAIRYFKQVTAARPTEGRWWAGFGISLEAQSDRENARAAYERASALALDPRLAEYVADRLKQLPR